MSVERLFFGQKYVVFWAKHLISILGIRFGGSRDEILTFGIAIRVITPPLLYHLRASRLMTIIDQTWCVAIVNQNYDGECVLKT